MQCLSLSNAKQKDWSLSSYAEEGLRSKLNGNPTGSAGHFAMLVLSALQGKPSCEGIVSGAEMIVTPKPPSPPTASTLHALTAAAGQIC